MDTSTIIWIVIIVGAMIYNSVSKARKARHNDDQTPPQHGEAWPSIPWENESGTGKPSRPDPTPATQQATARQSRPEPRAEELQKAMPAKGRDERDVAKSRELAPSTVVEAFPDECRSLEAIPDEVSIPEFSAFETEIWADDEVVDRQPDPAKNSAVKGLARQNSVKDKEPDNNSGEGVAEWIEEFDLKRAVIYSEILKPKFEE